MVGLTKNIDFFIQKSKDKRAWSFSFQKCILLLFLLSYNHVFLGSFSFVYMDFNFWLCFVQKEFFHYTGTTESFLLENFPFLSLRKDSEHCFSFQNWLRVITWKKQKKILYQSKGLSKDSHPHKVGFLGQVVFHSITKNSLIIFMTSKYIK